jgi:LysM repeat protein
VARRPWSHYAAPAAFLLAVTIAVFLVRSALEPASTAGTTTVSTAPAPAPTTATKTAKTTTTRATTTTKKKPPAPAAAYYTVVAGDTFGVISSKTGVPVARIEELNPGVESTALVIGQRIRIK